MNFLEIEKVVGREIFGFERQSDGGGRGDFGRRNRGKRYRSKWCVYR